jgi:hypothetical protein
MLDEFREKGASKAFNNYSVKVGSKKRVLKTELGPITVTVFSFYVESPNPDFNLFDMLDMGRPELPERDPALQSPYPIWGLRRPNGLINRRRSGDSFTRKNSQVVSGVRGKDPAAGVYSYGPIREVRAYNLYNRIFYLSQQRLKKEGFTHWEVYIKRRVRY